jgi:hypothetical protein
MIKNLIPPEFLARTCNLPENPSLLQRFICWLLGCCK